MFSNDHVNSYSMNKPRKGDEVYVATPKRTFIIVGRNSRGNFVCESTITGEYHSYYEKDLKLCLS